MVERGCESPVVLRPGRVDEVRFVHGLTHAVDENKLVVLMVDNNVLETGEGLWEGLRGKDNGTGRREKRSVKFKNA